MFFTGSIIKDLSSKETEISKKGMEKADQYLNKEEVLTPDEDGIFTVYSKSSLNKKALETSYEIPNYSDMSTGKPHSTLKKTLREGRSF